MGIRQKLWIGIGALLLILLLASGSAIWVIGRGNRAIEAVFRNNGDSVFYMHELSDGLDAINEGLKAGLPMDSQQVAKIERSLAGEAKGITEEGEEEAWSELEKAWSAYKLEAARLSAPGMRREAQRMKSLAWQITGLNLKNTRFRDHGRAQAWAEERWMALLLLSGAALGVGLMLLVGRSVLGPIRELQMAMAALKKLDEMKNGLLATVSHELKNPLTSLRLASHFLLEPAPGPLTEKQRELAETIQSESDRLHHILDELLALGRIEAGKDFLKPSLQDPRALIMATLAPFEPAFKSKGLKLDLKVAPGLPQVKADLERLAHVFSNLYENAIKYSPTGSHVEIGAAQEKGALRIWVKDQGPGIPLDFQGRIFERFFRVPGREVGPGSGLGLAIAKEIAEMHGGSLSVESREGQGATFNVTLPL